MLLRNADLVSGSFPINLSNRLESKFRYETLFYVFYRNGKYCSSLYSCVMCYVVHLEEFLLLNVLVMC